ncbi:MAG: ATP-binding protein [Candidatus Hydrothermarchaeales archaeon]
MDGWSKRRIILLLLIFACFLLSSPVHAQEEKSTILTAERISEPLTIDGTSDEPSWETARVLSIPVFDGKIGNVDVVLKALYDEEYIYMYITWPDKTQSDKLLWRYNGTTWIPPKSTEQDIFTIFFNIDDSVEGFDIAGCAITCHADRMHTNGPAERVDMWKWHAAYDNAARYMSDRYLDNTLVIGEKIMSGYSKVEIDKTWQSHKLDAAHTGYVDEEKNTKTDEEGNYLGPLYYEPDATDEDAYYLTEEEIRSGEAVELSSLNMLNGGSEIPVNFTVPGYIQERPRASAGDIDAVGTYRDGEWHLEIRRKLSTGNLDDIQFDTAKTYRFSIAVNDDSRGSANTGIGHGHSISLVAKTLEFGGTGSKEVVELALIRDYLVSGTAYVNRGESGLALSTISDALVVFNRIRGPVADIDPDLFIRIRNGFVDSRRDPSLENINQLIENLDLAILTFQGKRSPPEATLGLKILVLWGKFGVFAFIALAVIAIYPIYRMLKIIKRPQLRNLGIFMLIVVVPIFLEGSGRLGVLLKVPLLQNFSFTTSEYVTLLWALGMFIALYIGRIGFNEIDDTLKSLEDTSKELESKMGELRTSQEQLLKSERLASIGQLAASMAHELRNPLGVIKNVSYYLNMALRKSDEKVTKHLKILDQELSTSNKIITDLLDFSSGKEPVLQKVDINKTVKDSLKNLSVAKNIEVVEKYVGSLPKIMADSDQLKRVFINILINSLQAMPDGGTLSVKTEKTDDTISISFTDTGVGIPEKDLPQVFEPLFTTKTKGIGLGLALSRQIVELHGGSIEARSEVGKGTTFTIKLPITIL